MIPAKALNDGVRVTWEIEISAYSAAFIINVLTAVQIQFSDRLYLVPAFY